jgi:poly-gamma-glutamate synthesis protein (capsule biosynthesis protein)
LGNFIWSDLHEPLPAYFWERTRRSMGERAPDPATGTDAELLEVLNADAFDDPEVFRAVIAEVVPGEVVRLHPVELGYGEPLTRRGIPRLAPPDVAGPILDAIAERSKPFGVRVDGDGTVTT